MLSPNTVTKILEKNITEFKFFRYNQIFSKSILETIREPLYAISICSLLKYSSNEITVHIIHQNPDSFNEYLEKLNIRRINSILVYG